ncbi:GNAT family N-acetyltransferase [Spirosoma montaniterrae]|uniref:GNAT family acetyltransferase n=1 Tax=Spirosoma montaniterrae TaxID=1178516 RepID=A0A1P9WW91_9BACT|nr:GNAT family N-acetyltransferase [Spirosoma montaniterrae]AQG79633.1 GNAT family acetyltransferase [Spirosoma montaniterrae]
MDTPVTLQTQRLRLRPWLPADAEPFARMNADPEVMAHYPTRLTRAQSDEQMNRLARHITETGWGLWAVEVIDIEPFIGYCGLWPATFDAPFTPAIEIGWRIARPFWGKSYAFEAAEAAMNFGFETLGLAEIVSFTTPANVRSQRLMERLGMSRNPADDFDHPRLPVGHPMRPHVLYRKSRDLS